MKIKWQGILTLFLSFALIVASCAQPDIPKEDYTPPPAEEEYLRTGRWTNIQDESDYITFSTDTTFTDAEGKNWNIDEKTGTYYISQNSKKDIVFDQFYCVYLEEKGFYHKDDSPIVDDTTSSLGGGLWNLSENKFYLFHPGNGRYYAFDYHDYSFSEQGTYVISNGHLNLSSENGSEYSFPIEKSYGKNIIGDIVISPKNNRYSSEIASYAGTYGHQGYYMNAILDEYGFGKLGAVNGFVYIDLGNRSLCTKGFEDRFDSSGQLFGLSRISLKKGETAVGDTSIDEGFSGIWERGDLEFKIDAEKSVAEHNGKIYYLRDDGSRLFLYDADDYIMYYILEKANDMLYCKEFLLGFSETNNAYEAISLVNGYKRTGDWNTDIESPEDPVDPPQEISLTGTWESSNVYKPYVFNADGSCLYPIGEKQEEGTWKLDYDGKYRIYSITGISQAQAKIDEITGELRIESTNHEDASFTKGEGQYPMDENIFGAWILNGNMIHDFSPDGHYFGSGMMGEECWYKTAENKYHLYDENGDRISTKDYSIMGTSIVINSLRGDKYEYPSGYLTGYYVDAFTPDEYFIKIDSLQNATIKLGPMEYQCKTYPEIDEITGDILLNLYFTGYEHNAGSLYRSVRLIRLDDDAVYAVEFPLSYPTANEKRKVLLVDASKKELIHTSEKKYINEQYGKEIRLEEDGKMLTPSGEYVSYVLVGGKIYYEEGSSRYNVSSWSEGSMIFDGNEYLESETGILPEPEFTSDPALLGRWHNTLASRHFVHYYFKDDGTMLIGNDVVYGNVPYRYTTHENSLYMWVDGYYTSSYVRFDYSVSGDELRINDASFTRCYEEDLAYIKQPSSIREIAGKYVLDYEGLEIVQMIEIDTNGNGTIIYDSHSLYELKFIMEDGKLKTYLIKSSHHQDISDYCFYTTKGLYYGGLLLTRTD